MKTYKLCFQEQINGKQVYFDFQRDALVFRNQLVLDSFYGHLWLSGNANKRHRKHYMADLLPIETQLRNISMGCQIECLALSALRRFHNLEKITYPRPRMIGYGCIQFDGNDRLLDLVRYCTDAAEKWRQNDYNCRRWSSFPLVCLWSASMSSSHPIYTVLTGMQTLPRTRPFRVSLRLWRTREAQ
jgi:hypothetical protein